MKNNPATAWWRDSAPEFGPRIMDSTLRGETDWEKVLENGRQELQRVLGVTGMRTGRDLALLEIGCGMGRMSFALADHYGYVFAIDVSSKLIETAKSHNTRENVHFELTDGERVRPSDPRTWDVVFSFGVFYHLERDTIRAYFSDVAALLRPGGQFAFDVNCQPFRLTTRASFLVRRILFQCGVKDWRGWPTDPGFRRRYHPAAHLREWLTEAGLQVEKVVGDPRDTWFVATKPL